MEVRMVIRNAGLDLNGPLSLAVAKTGILFTHDLNASCSHVPRPESRIGVVRKTTSVCTSSLTTFAAAWTLSLETMAAATLEAASRTGTFSMVESTTNLGPRMARRHFFRNNPGSVYIIKMVASIFDDNVVKAHGSVHSSSSYCPSPSVTA
ncbi:hypothetical protein TNCV_1178301 [Trichonephila clavipes]|nr:hypothetical protein TNCV_1178301 [Trichonephila clavipes]